MCGLAIELSAKNIEDRWHGIVDDVKDEYLSENQRYPWIIGFSGGKDSTVVAPKHTPIEAHPPRLYRFQ